MVKIPKKQKMNNLGMTLVEIVVAIAIIGMVAVPLMNMFVSGMRTNRKAKETEAAQIAAQNVAEAFEATDINDLFDQMNANGTIEVGKYKNITVLKSGAQDDDGNSAKYTLTFGDKIDGDTSENYTVSAVLEVKDTTKGTSTLPDLVDIGSGSVTTMRICNDYYKYDVKYDPSACTKVSTFNITCTHLGEKKYKYDISLDIKYGSDTEAGAYSASNTIEYDGSNEINLFLLCNYFYMLAPKYTTDQVIINYNYSGDADKEIPCSVFLMQQDIEYAGHGVEFDPANITVKKNGYTGMKLYSNITGLQVDGVDVTSVDTKDIFNVYELTVVTKGENSELEGRVDTTMTR